MNNLTNMGLASNEAKEQRIMRLRNAFSRREVITVESASKKTGYSLNTIRKWAKEGDIPLWDPETGTSVVPLTSDNRPKWLD